MLFFIQNRMEDVTYLKLLNVSYYMREDRHCISSNLLFEVFDISRSVNIYWPLVFTFVVSQILGIQ